MLDKLTQGDFEPHLNTTFRLLRRDATPLELKLVEVTPGVSSNNSRSFSLVFRGGPHFRLNQHIYSLEHDRLGTLDIFLVPIAQDAEGFTYEAVFNHPA